MTTDEMKTYFYILKTKKVYKMDEFKAKCDEDFQNNIGRVLSDKNKLVAFDTDEEVVKYKLKELIKKDKELEDEKRSIPKDLIPYLDMIGALSRFRRFWESICTPPRDISNWKVDGKYKPYFTIASWGTGANYSFATREEVIDLIIEQKEADSDDGFDLEILLYPEGNEVTYDVEYNVTLKVEQQ